jgi:hypothetical protein
MLPALQMVLPTLSSLRCPPASLSSSRRSRLISWRRRMRRVCRQLTTPAFFPRQAASKTFPSKNGWRDSASSLPSPLSSLYSADGNPAQSSYLSTHDVSSLKDVSFEDVAKTARHPPPSTQSTSLVRKNSGFSTFSTTSPTSRPIVRRMSHSLSRRESNPITRHSRI